MKRSSVCTGVGAVLVVMVLVASGPVLAAAAKPAVTQPEKGKKPPSKVSFVDAPSSEKPAAREKRLKRECKGRPNAGMCLGHTR